MMKISKLISALVLGVSCICLIPISAIAQDTPVQSGPASPYQVIGEETPVSELPIISGRWYNSRGNASNVLKIQGGKLQMWNGSKCGEAVMTVEKVFQNSSSMLIEAGPPAEVIRCGLEDGFTLSYDKSSKKGYYLVRGSKSDRTIKHYGKLEID